MRKIVSIVAVTALLLTGGLIACKDKKKSDDIIVAKYVPETLKAPIQLPAETRTTPVKWQGKDYVVTLTRATADSTKNITDENGQQYYDNHITLTIAQANNTVFLKKLFTKESFASYIEKDFRQKGILETIAFHEVDDQCLKFGVVVSRPENDDLFIPLDMWIDQKGGISIKQGKLFDEVDKEEEDQ